MKVPNWIVDDSKKMLKVACGLVRNGKRCCYLSGKFSTKDYIDDNGNNWYTRIYRMSDDTMIAEIHDDFTPCYKVQIQENI